MIGGSPQEVAILLSLYPILFALVAWYMFRKSKNKKEPYLVLSLLIMVLAYVFLPDPSLIQKLYVEGGDVQPVLLYGTIGGVLLFIAIFYFKKHVGEG